MALERIKMIKSIQHIEFEVPASTANHVATATINAVDVNKSLIHFEHRHTNAAALNSVSFKFNSATEVEMEITSANSTAEIVELSVAVVEYY